MMVGANGFNPYAAGAKRYGPNASSAAQQGPMSASGMQGYQDRDRRNKVRQQTYLRWMQDNSTGAHGSANALRRG